MSILHIDEKNYETEVLKSETPVLLDFYADWCGPCKALSPILEEVAKSLEPKAKVVKINVDDNEKLAESFGIMSIPALIIMNGGEEQTRINARTKDQIISAINKFLI